MKRNLENDVIKGMLEAGEPIYGYCSPEYVKDVGTVDRVNQTLADIERGVIAGKCLRNKQRCIFMDRDGTINQYKGLVYKEEDLRWRAAQSTRSGRSTSREDLESLSQTSRWLRGDL